MIQLNSQSTPVGDNLIGLKQKHTLYMKTSIDHMFRVPRFRTIPGIVNIFTDQKNMCVSNKRGTLKLMIWWYHFF